MVNNILPDILTRPMSRRTFLHSAGRLIVATFLIVLGGFLYKRNHCDNQNANLAEGVSPCGQCSKSSGCGLPQANDFRKSGNK